MKEVNIYIKETYDSVITKDGHYDVLLTTQGKELRFKKFFLNTAHHKLILYGAIDAIKKLNQSCIINLYTTMPFGMKRIRHSDGTWRTDLGRSVNIDLLLELRNLIRNRGHKLNNVYDKELVEIMLRVEGAQSCTNGIIANSQLNVPEESSYFNQSNYDKIENCKFCNLDSNIDMIYQTATCAAFYVADSVSSGHALIIPKRHVVSYFDLTKKEREAMDTMLMLVKKIIDGRFHPDGYNVGFEVNEVAGQSIPHVHIHIIPCYKKSIEIQKDGLRKESLGKWNHYKDNDKLDNFLKCHIDNKGIHEDTKLHKDSMHCEKSAEHQKAYTVEQKREEYGNAYLPWDDEADALLVRMYEIEGKSIQLLSEIFERGPGAIRSRLKKLGKIE